MRIWNTERLTYLLKVIQKIPWSNQKFCAALPSSALWHYSFGRHVFMAWFLCLKVSEIRFCHQGSFTQSLPKSVEHVLLVSVGQLKTSGSKAILHFWCEPSVPALDHRGSAWPWPTKAPAHNQEKLTCCGEGEGDGGSFLTGHVAVEGMGLTKKEGRRGNGQRGGSLCTSQWNLCCASCVFLSTPLQQVLQGCDHSPTVCK